MPELNKQKIRPKFIPYWWLIVYISPITTFSNLILMSMLTVAKISLYEQRISRVWFLSLLLFFFFSTNAPPPPPKKKKKPQTHTQQQQNKKKKEKKKKKKEVKMKWRCIYISSYWFQNNQSCWYLQWINLDFKIWVHFSFNHVVLTGKCFSLWEHNWSQ